MTAESQVRRLAGHELRLGMVMLFQNCVRAHKERLSMDIVPHIQCSVTGQEYKISCIIMQHYNMINELPFLRQ